MAKFSWSRWSGVVALALVAGCGSDGAYDSSETTSATETGESDDAGNSNGETSGSGSGSASGSSGDGDGDSAGDGDGDSSGDGDGDSAGDGDGDGDSSGDGDGDSSGDGDGDSSGDGDGDGDSSGDGDGEPPPLCGDGLVEGNEACDLGDANADDGECTTSCTLAECGDGLVWAGVEDCDDGGESPECNADCTPALCGDAILNEAAGETCDDGNDNDDDGCIDPCTLASCGDGFVWAGEEECDDGNADDGDGCDSECVIEPLGQIYLSSAAGDPGFWRYDIADDSWSARPLPPRTTLTQLTNDSEFVYLMGSNNQVYRYDPDEDAWTILMVGPGPFVNTMVGYFQWFDEGFYYLQDGSINLHVYRDGAWDDLELPNLGSSAGTWDPATSELYIRTYTELGFWVVDTTTDNLVRTIADPTMVTEHSRTGAYYEGLFYARTFDGPIQRLDAQDGDKVDTGLGLASANTASDTDFYAGRIYFSGFGDDSTAFQAYDIDDGVVLDLADQPAVPNHSTITVMRPPGD